MGDRQRTLYFLAAAAFFGVALMELFDDGFGFQSALSAVVGGTLFGLGLLKGRRQR